MPDNLYRLKWWFRGKVHLVDVRDVSHAQAVLDNPDIPRGASAVVLSSATHGVNAGQWFLYQILR